MNLKENLIFAMQKTMETPKPYGWFHILWIILTLGGIFFLYLKRKNHNEKQLKTILSIYGITAFILEALKQISWSMNYDTVSKIITWDYTWYSFPFQLCTTPIFVSIICIFLKNNKIRQSLLSYMAYITILGSIATIIIPTSCFTSEIMINIHTMWLHCGSLVVSVYLLISKEVTINYQNLKRAIITFIIFVIIAQILNIGIYQSGILNEESFNMFYISPYFISSLPVFDIIQKAVPYITFLIIYLLTISSGAYIIYGIASLLKINKPRR